MRMSHRPSQVTPLAWVPVSRSRAFERALFRLGPGAFLLCAGWWVIGRLNLTPSAVSNRITEYSLLAICLPIMLTALAAALTGFRWLLLALWPARIGIAADADAVVFHLGPMGTKRYDATRIEVRYLFELPRDAAIEDDMIYESLLPARVQMDNHLPYMSHPAAPQRLDRLIIHYARASEKQLAATLRPFTTHMRRDRPEPDDEKEDE